MVLKFYEYIDIDKLIIKIYFFLNSNYFKK